MLSSLRSFYRYGMCLLLLPLSVIAAEDMELSAILAEFAKQTEFHGHFKEEKISGILAQSLELEGELSYRAPAYLEKHIRKPYDERQIIDGDQVIIENSTDGQRRVLSLGTVPELKIVVDSLRATLAGNLKALQENYRVSRLPEADGWHLRLRPRDEELGETLREIHIQGRGQHIGEFRIVQTGGGESRVVITALP